MFIKRRHAHDRAERGDTLVEVLVSIVVVSTIIGGAYVVSNHSMQSNRAAQERSAALKLGESQLEQLKGLVATNANAIFGATAPAKFCIGNGTTVYDATSVSQKANCTVDSGGGPTTSQPAYTIVVTRSGNNFTLNETWDDISGTFTDQLQLNYRVYQ